MNKPDRHIGIRLILLAVFLCYYSDITFFTHSHVICGKTIVHSHFIFGKDNPANEGHSHNTNQLMLIASAANWVADFTAVPQVCSAFITNTLCYYSKSFTKIDQKTPSAQYLRDPPTL